jgi:2-polyprenyl-3-methyl-5-hydroxy-6-metoxy-1,4-benzoquinol methylase
MHDYTKRQVEIWNKDVENHGGYFYSKNPPYSARVAHARISRQIHGAIPAGTMSIVDFGCGDAMYTQELAHAFPAAKIIGLDPAQAAIEYAEQQWPLIDFRVADLLDATTLPDILADVGIIRAVLHHLPDDSQNLAIYNASQRCRRLIILEPNGNNPIVKLFEKYSAYHILHEEKSYTSNELLAWCVESQWQQVSHVFIGFVPTFFPEWPARFIHFVQPLLEKIPLIKTYLSAQIVVVCTNKTE